MTNVLSFAAHRRLPTAAQLFDQILEGRIAVEEWLEAPFDGLIEHGRPQEAAALAISALAEVSLLARRAASWAGSEGAEARVLAWVAAAMSGSAIDPTEVFRRPGQP